LSIHSGLSTIRTKFLRRIKVKPGWLAQFDFDDVIDKFRDYLASVLPVFSTFAKPALIEDAMPHAQSLLSAKVTLLSASA